jgi:4-hydroxybenzoate polyprenyltransferase
VLNALCTVLFVSAALLEVAYCALAKVTPLKFILSGVMVAAGAVAGWFALRQDVDWLRFALLFGWVAAWEVGGRNIPGDWADVQEDSRLGIKTVPVVYGLKRSAVLVSILLCLTILGGVGLMALSWASFGLLGLVGAIIAGGYALLGPGARLMRDPSPSAALALFNRASAYPVLILVSALAGLAIRELGGG